MTLDPKEIKPHQLYGYLVSAVAPRPIAFASTVDAEGNVNLSPFSFFNVFGSNPSTLIFSPNRRGRDNTNKHTFLNIQQHGEVVINVVNYAMVHQVSLASSEYPDGVNEFEKAGLTAIPSEIVKPPRVKESPVQIECKVRQIIETGDQGGAANLIICEVVKMHIDDAILDADGKIDQHKIDLVARLGGGWYSRASGDSLFEIPKPLTTLGIGVDSIPSDIRYSKILTGNHLGMLGNVESLPSAEEVKAFRTNPGLNEVLNEGTTSDEAIDKLHRLAAVLLNEGNVTDAWKVLLHEYYKSVR